MSGTSGRVASLEHRPGLAIDDFASLRIAETLGAGLAMLPKEFLDDDLQSGRLLRILPDLESKAGLVHAIFASRRGMVPAVRQLLDAIVAGYSKPDGK